MPRPDPYRKPAHTPARAKVPRGNRDSLIKRIAIELARPIAIATSISALILASGPLFWLIFLVIRGAIWGVPLQVFYDQTIWQFEFVAKLPVALALSSLGAIPAFVGILIERKPKPKCTTR